MAKRPIIYDAAGAVSEDTLREFAEFLKLENAGETQLHRLLEDHPTLIGALGYVRFLSESRILKLDGEGEVIVDDARRLDRPDVIAAKESPVQTRAGQPFIDVDLIELKGPLAEIASRDGGVRLSEGASDGIGQLDDYKIWLTEVDENLPQFVELGWRVSSPRRFLIMGRDSEFEGRPDQLSRIKEHVLSQRGVQVYTMDDLFRMAQTSHESGEYARIRMYIEEDRPLIAAPTLRTVDLDLKAIGHPKVNMELDDSLLEQLVDIYKRIPSMPTGSSLTRELAVLVDRISKAGSKPLEDLTRAVAASRKRISLLFESNVIPPNTYTSLMEEQDRKMRAILFLNRQNAIRPLVIRAPSLQDRDWFIVGWAAELALTRDSYNASFGYKELLSELRKKGLTDKEVKESMRVLSDLGYVDARVVTGGFDGGRLTRRAFEEWCRTNIPNFDRIGLEVAQEIIAGVLRAPEIAKKIGQARAIVEFFLRELEDQGYLTRSFDSGSDPHSSVSIVRPTLARWVEENASPDEDTQGDHDE